jgi:hypothetical protein
MMHRQRRWTIADVADPAELAEQLTTRTWCSCQGWRHAGYLYLNDATGEDGAQEYGVVKEATLLQVESITFGWIDATRALGYIAQIGAGAFDDGRYDLIHRSQIETAEQHSRCPLCA